MGTPRTKRKFGIKISGLTDDEAVDLFFLFAEAMQAVAGVDNDGVIESNVPRYPRSRWSAHVARLGMGKEWTSSRAKRIEAVG